MFRYYTRFREIDEQPGGQYDILQAAYEVDKINEISKRIGLSSLNISTFLFKQKLENYYKVKIETEISNIKNCGSGKLKLYSKIVMEFKQPGYLDYDIPKSLRNKLSKIRISAHSLAVETGRYTKPVTPSDQRTCKYCKHIVDDEIHFLFQCPQYSSIRSTFGIDEKVLAPTDILDEEMIKTINPVSPKDLKSICMYIQQALDTLL
jgi:DNA-binding transcriptional regulator LsrR (DeoR family)